MAKNRPPAPEPLTRERVLEALRKAGGKAQKRDIARELGIGAGSEERAAPHPARAGRIRRARPHRPQALRRCASAARIRRHGHRRSRSRRRAARAHARAGGIFRPDWCGLRPAKRGACAAKLRSASATACWRGIDRGDDGEFEARVVKRLGQSAHRILGVYRAQQRPRAALRRRPRRAGRPQSAPRPHHRTPPMSATRKTAISSSSNSRRPARAARMGPSAALIKEIIGTESDPRAASILAMHTHGIQRGLHRRRRSASQRRAEADAQGPHRSPQRAADHHRP